jgi:hypothetical protein
MRNKQLLFFLFLLVGILFNSSQINPQQFQLRIVAKSPGDLNLNYTNAKTWPVSSGLNVVPIFKKVYLSADTSGAGITYSWSITQKPAGSTVNLDSVGTKGNSFIPDMQGSYTISVTAGGKTVTSNIFASKFRGVTLTQNCAPCHQGDFNKFPSWDSSLHATMYKRGITGMLAVNNSGNGLYGNYCVKCHTLSWDSTSANGNYGYLAHQTGWDTTWFRPGTLDTNGTIQIPQGDSSRWVRLRNQFQIVEPTANIGCETCHGPATDHANTGNPQFIAVSLSAGACNQCHDAPPGYPVGGMWKASRHATLPNSSAEAGRTICYPCHSGAAFVKFTKNKANPGYSAATDNFPSISCATCHDPHRSANFGLRTLALDSLANGYKPSSDASFRGGLGVLCMNCHHGRENSLARVTSQAKKYTDRFYPHYGVQGDMLLGANAFEYDLKITGNGTHKFIQDACVTCHMADDPSTEFGVANHQMKMTDAQDNDRVYVCKTCHADVSTSFDDIKAPKDWDGNGKIEGVQTEIQGLLDKLKAILPKDTSGEVVTRASDSTKVKSDPNYPRILPAIWDYWYVKNDGSLGVHNAVYTAAILQASLNTVTGVKQTDNEIPKQYTLAQNYPNPFNPATTISFSIPEASVVTLRVYDVLGNEVATLHRGFLAAGNYKFDWNASTLASGVYYYRLTTDKFTQTKKMLLLK